MSGTDFLSWDRLVLEGETLYTYMINNYDKMFDGEKTIKHFGIAIGSIGFGDYVNEIKEKYHTDIQNELIPWIKKEIESNNLFQNKNWNTFRDPDILVWMFLGYRKMFQYKQYIFQLSLDASCGYEFADVFCKYCSNKEYNSGEDTARFLLVFYGWKDEKYENLQPEDFLTISDDYLMPESFWMREINWIRKQQEMDLHACWGRKWINEVIWLDDI